MGRDGEEKKGRIGGFEVGGWSVDDVRALSDKCCLSSYQIEGLVGCRSIDNLNSTM